MTQAKPNIKDHATPEHEAIAVDITWRSGDVNYAHTYASLLDIFDITDLAVTLRGKRLWLSDLNPEDFTEAITAAHSGAVLTPTIPGVGRSLALVNSLL